MICDHIRDLQEFENLYKTRPMANQYDFDWLINNPLLFCFYGEGEDKSLKGYLTVQDEEGELTLSGAAVRKNMADNIDAIIFVCNAIKQDIYSYTYSKPARICLLKAGFKHIKDDKYIRRYANNG